MKKIFVTKTFLPNIKEFIALLKPIWRTSQLTNNGNYVKKLKSKLELFLSQKNLTVVSSGDVALSLAIKALDVRDEVITTPFSYVSTTNSILWHQCKPIFVDIDPNSFCIDVRKIEKSITSKTTAIIATHVFGNPCDIKEINNIAKKYNLIIIYDAAHAFDIKIKNRSILNCGDASILSFHATKVFHTIEGGAVITKNKKLFNKVNLMKQFGHNGDDYRYIGINAKMSELHAAMGLLNLKNYNKIVKARKEKTSYYDNFLDDLYLKSKLMKQKINNDVSYNYSYYPIVFRSESMLKKTLKELNRRNYFPRRYFYPSLNTLKFLDKNLKVKCPVAESISKRILCLPNDYYIDKKNIENISNIIKEALS